MSTACVVVGYPVIAKKDFEWIQAVRKTNDRLYSVVEPHFTFVFPTEKLSADELAQHTASKVKQFPRIPISLTEAIVVEDDRTHFKSPIRPEITQDWPKSARGSSP